MSTVLRWTLRILGGVVALCLLFFAYVYIASVVKMGRTYPRRDVAITIPTDSASIARGEHLARLSCHGCHGDSLSGAVMFDAPGIARIAAPNVIERMAAYTDAQFAGYLRYGAKIDGKSGFVMPPPGFYHMSDADQGSLIAYLHTRKKARTSDTVGTSSYGPMGRMGVALGQFRTAIMDIDTTQARVGADPAYTTTREGEYFARMICTSCHSNTLTGDPNTGGAGSPNLSNAVGYSFDEFKTLIRTGKPRTDKKLTLMGDVARGELHNLTDSELANVYAYLKSLPASGVVLK
jgi:mono/diheme cytochrome c family protein